jgi:hypothetical protein
MSAQGKQPRAPRKALPCVVGLHHTQSRLRSPGLRMVESAQSPERAQQMTSQINTGAQAGIIRDKNECRTTPGYTIERAPLRCASEGDRRTGPWRLLRPFRAIWNLVTGNPGPRDRSQDSRLLPLG